MKKVLVLVLLGFIVVGCEMRNTPKMTPMEIQSLQTRDFESSKDIVFPSVVSVFQDIGYTITSADIATGLVVAEVLLIVILLLSFG
jgi:PBP1b-binding outer membrane lipoprotein LpoB